MNNWRERKIEGQKLAYSIDEVSVLLGVSCGHLRNENKRGNLRFVKSGRRVLILDEELRRYLEANDATVKEKNGQKTEVEDD